MPEITQRLTSGGNQLCKTRQAYSPSGRAICYTFFGGIMQFNSFYFIRKIARPYPLWERIWIYFLLSPFLDCIIYFPYRLLTAIKQKQLKYALGDIYDELERF